jgi:hypothetical protein
MASGPIPRDLAEAFRSALLFYRSSWTPAFHGPEVSINGRSSTIEKVCRLVAESTDELPKELLVSLLACMDDRYRGPKSDLEKHSTYQTASRCLLLLLRDREADWRKRRLR